MFHQSSTSSMLKIDAAGNITAPTGLTSWDEQGHGNIVQILIWHNNREIHSIQFQYAENGKLVLSNRHRPSNGSTTNAKEFVAVKLNYPSEYITSVSGLEDGYSGDVVSLKFGTNTGEYGPFGYGTNKGEYGPLSGCATLSVIPQPIRYRSIRRVDNRRFCFEFGEPSQFGGFYGTMGSTRLASIGVYLNLNTTNKNLKSPKEEK